MKRVEYAKSHNRSVGKKVLIIGAGYIGLEVAAVLRTQGLEVTVIEMADRILKRVTSVQMSQYMTELHCRHGVEIKTATQIKSSKLPGSKEGRKKRRTHILVEKKEYTG